MNSNRPRKRSIICVEPIRSLNAIASIKKRLASNPRDFALFVVGINIAFRASDLLALTVGQVRNLEAGSSLPVREIKTDKERRVTFNAAAISAIQGLLASMPDSADSDPLFQSRKGGSALLVPTLNNMVKSWCADLKGNYGSHTLRKTFGFHHRVTFKTDLPTITKIFGHSTQAQTLHYLCIHEEEVKDAYMQEL